MDKDLHDTPLSESNVSLKLADIQKRCSELLDEPADSLGLTLEEPAIDAPKKKDHFDPYDRG